MSLKKLQLNKETLRFLAPEEVDYLAIGVINEPPKTKITCPPPASKTCNLTCNIICDLKIW